MRNIPITKKSIVPYLTFFLLRTLTFAGMFVLYSALTGHPLRPIDFGFSLVAGYAVTEASRKGVLVGRMMLANLDGEVPDPSLIVDKAEELVRRLKEIEKEYQAEEKEK